MGAAASVSQENEVEVANASKSLPSLVLTCDRERADRRLGFARLPKSATGNATSHHVDKRDKLSSSRRRQATRQQ